MRAAVGVADYISLEVIMSTKCLQVSDIAVLQKRPRVASIDCVP
jgi:hypothetical protein